MMNDNNVSAKSTQGESTDPWTGSTWFRYVLVIVFASGIFFRLSGLENKMYSHDEVYTSLYSAGYRGGEAFDNLWDGEVKTVKDLQTFLAPDPDKGVADTLSILALYEPHQAPLFYLLEHYWMRIIGYTPAAMRGLATLFGFLSIPAMYWLSRELFHSSRVALLSSAIFIISPYHILMAQDARAYSLFALVVIVSTAAFLRALRERNTKNWAMYSLTLITGAYSHLLFLLVAIAHGAFLIGIRFADRQKGSGPFFGASLFALFAFLPWVYFMVSRWGQAATKLDWVNYQFPWYRYIQRWILLFGSTFLDFDFNSNLLNLFPYLLRVLILIFLVYALFYLVKHGPGRGKWLVLLIYIFTAGSFIVLDLLFGGIRSTVGRYFVPANIASVLVLAWFLVSRLDVSVQAGQTHWKRLISVLALAGILSNFNSLLAETWWNKELGRVGQEFIHTIDKDQTLLVVSGSHPTNLGDILLLGFELDQEVQIQLYRDPEAIGFTGDYQNIYWFPSSYEEVQRWSAKRGLEVKEALPWTLWTILDREE